VGRRGTVEVWLLDIRPEGGTGLEALAQRLPAGERAAAARYGHGGERRRHVAGRALLRTVLGDRLGRAPEAIALTADGDGKPRLAVAGAEEIDFSISHSGDLVAVAVAEGAAVGVDVQRIAPRDVVHLAERWFTPGEATTIRAACGPAAMALFHRLWSAKEAWLKAQGAGLRRRPGSFQVRMQGSRGAVEDPACAEGGSIHFLDAGGRHAGAVAVAAARAPAPTVHRLVLKDHRAPQGRPAVEGGEVLHVPAGYEAGTLSPVPASPCRAGGISG